jgi:hypothetical protein
MPERNESDAQLQSSPPLTLGNVAGESPQHEYVPLHEMVIPRLVHEVLLVPVFSKGSGPHRQSPLLESSKQHVVCAELFSPELPPELLPQAEMERANINALGTAANQPEPKIMNADITSSRSEKSCGDGRATPDSGRRFPLRGDLSREPRYASRS